MRVLSIFIICISLAFAIHLISGHNIQPAKPTINPPTIAYEKLASLKIKEIQKIIGRKLTFKEKISLLVLKHTSEKAAQTKKGNTAFIFGIVGVGLLIIGLFVPFVILGFDCRSYCRNYFRFKRKKNRTLLMERPVPQSY